MHLNFAYTVCMKWTEYKRQKMQKNNSENKHQTRFNLYKMWSVNSYFFVSCWPQRTVKQELVNCHFFDWESTSCDQYQRWVSLEINNEKVVLRHETKPIRCTERNMLSWIMFWSWKCYESHSVWSVFPQWLNRCDQEERRR